MKAEVEDLYGRLVEIQQSLEARLNLNVKDYAALGQWNRIVIMKETLKLLSGTCDVTIEILASGVFERGNWK